MHYDYDNDKKQDTKSVLKPNNPKVTLPLTTEMSYYVCTTTHRSILRFLHQISKGHSQTTLIRVGGTRNVNVTCVYFPAYKTVNKFLQ
jgi:hypothetical protein